MGKLQDRTLVSVVVLLIFGVLLSTVLGYNVLTKETELDAYNQLYSNAAQQTKEITDKIQTSFDVLELTAKISVSDIMSEGKGHEQLALLLRTFNKGDLYFVNTDGETLYSSVRANLSSNDFFNKALRGDRAISRLDKGVAGNGIIALAVPCVKNGQTVGVVCGIFDNIIFKSASAVRVFDGTGYCALLDANGQVFAATDMDKPLSDSETKSVIEGLEYESTSEREKLKTDMSNADSGTVRVRLNGDSQIIVYTPLEVEGETWYLFSAVSAEMLTRNTGRVLKVVYLQLGIMLAFCTLAAVLIYRDNKSRARQLMAEAETARIRKEQYAIVLRQSNRNVFSYDVAKRSITNEILLDSHFLDCPDGEDFIERLIENNAIESRSVDDYRNFFRRIDEGENPVTEDILFNLTDDSMRWYRLTASSVFGDDGKPKSALVSAFDCTNERLRESAYEKWTLEMAMATKDGRLFHEWNLNKNICESEQGEKAQYMKEHNFDTFEERTAYYCRTIVHPDDCSAYLTFMNRERLIGAYHDGTYTDSLNYREETRDGSYHWNQVSVWMMPFPSSGDIRCFISKRDIDAQVKTELEQEAFLEKDILTGVYNRDALVNHAARLFENEPQSVHAIMVLDINDFRRINNSYGYEFGDEVLHEFAKALSFSADENDICGRMGGGEFMIITPDIPFDAAINKKAGRLCASFVSKLDSKVTLSISIGVSVFPRDGESFEELYGKAVAALRSAKEGKYGYRIYDDSMERLISRSSAAKKKTVRKRKNTILAIYNDSAEAQKLYEEYKNEYNVLSPEAMSDALSVLGDNLSSIKAILVDIDIPFGRNFLKRVAAMMNESQLPIIVVTDSEKKLDAETEAIIKNNGVSVVVRPVDGRQLANVVTLQINLSNSIREQIQKGYSRLQSEEDERNSLILAATETVVFVYDPFLHTYTANSLAKKYIAADFDGRRVSEILSSGDVVSKEDAEKNAELIKEIAEGKKDMGEMELRIKTPSGERRWFRARYIAIKGEGKKTRKVLLTLNDENERIEAEEKLKNTSERLATIMANITSGVGAFVMVGENDTRSIFVNDRYYEILGYTKQQYQQEVKSASQIIYKDDYKPLFENVKKNVFNGDGRFVDKFRANTRDGRVLWLKCSYTLTKFDEIDEKVMLVLLSDITSEVEAQTVRAENERLEIEVEEAQKASRSKGDFLTHVSHDFRTPMNAIIGFSEHELTDDASEKQKDEFLEKINATGKYMLSLINDVLDISKIESGKVVLNKTPEKLSCFFDDIETVIKPLADKRKIDFKTIRRGITVETIVCDRMRLQQIFINLLNNAVKFTPEGGDVEFEVQQMKATKWQASFRFYVRDTGRGMSREFQKRLYDPFEQEGVDTQQGQGTGLGLSIVKSLVELYNGRIEVESELGRGTTFTVDLTFDVSERELEKSANASENINNAVLEGRRVLLCEDHPLNSEIAARLLKKVGLKSELAVNGKLGVEMFAASKPGYYSAVLMDVRMPIMDGITATKQIRALDREDAKTIPIIAMTANAFDEDVKMCREAGMNEHLAKPIVPARLFKALSEYIGK